MLKKKNMAIMMAVATVATTAAPAFAAVEAQNVDEAKLIADVTAKLDTKYSDRKETGEADKLTEATEENAYRNSVYKIEAGYDKQAQTEVTNIKDFKKTIEEAKLNEAKLNVTITDKGHKEVDGRIVATENTKYTYYTQADLNGIAADNKAITKVELNEDHNAVLTLKNKSEIVLSTSDYVLDLKAAVDTNGNAIDLENANDDVLKRVVGFKKVEADKATDIDLPSKVESKLVFDAAKAATKVEAQYSELVTNEGYTKQGKEVVDTLRKADTTDGTDVIRNGKKYNVKTTLADAKVEAVKGAGYQLVYKLNVKEGQNTSTVNYVVVDNNQKHLADLKNVVADKTVDITEGRYTKLAGEDRFKTAIEVSKKSYVKHDVVADDTKKAKGIVLVGENAIVDGLASAPLAAQKQAPILLTNKDALSVETVAEMKRVIKENPTVYIVGGEAVISKDVEKQLITELNAHIVRLAGEDRHATSVEIAKEIAPKVEDKDAKVQKAFIVGGEGEADAMSIASIAAIDNSPIIVSPAAGLTKDAKKLLEKNGQYAVIGGTSKVSTQVLREVREFDANASRISGVDRHETNAEVITTYVKGAQAVYVAKDGYAEGNGQLIDALAVAPLAAKTQAPIVLATSDLTKEQTKAVETVKDTKKPLTQAGNGVTTTVTQKLLKILGL